MIGGQITHNKFLIDADGYLALLQNIYGKKLKEIVLLKSDDESICLAVFVEDFNDDYAQYIEKCKELKYDMTTSDSKPLKVIFTTLDYANFVTRNIPCYKIVRKHKTIWRKDEQYAVGDIRLDGITPTAEFQEYAEKERRGELTPADKQQFLRKSYTTEEPPATEVRALSERFLEKNKEVYKTLASHHKERPE